MALTDEEKQTFRRSELLKQLKARPPESGPAYSFPLYSLNIAMGRAFILEDEFKELARIAENQMDDLVTITIEWCASLFQIVKKN